MNIARWLGSMVPATAAAGFLLGCAILMIRGGSAGPDANVETLLWRVVVATGLLLGAGGAVAFYAVRRRRYSLKEGFVRLDIQLGLHSRLESAAAGVGEWPEPLPLSRIDDGFRWRWRQLFTPLFIAGAFLIAALYLPIAPRAFQGTRSMEMPLAWEQVKGAIEELRKEELLDPEAVVAYEQKLESLQKLEKERWYLHSSLEAGETLRGELAAAATELERQLDLASKALEQQAAADPQAAFTETIDPKQWNELLEGMQAAALPLEKSKLDALRQLATESPLSEGQRKALQEALQRGELGAKGALEALGNMEGLGDALAARAEMTTGNAGQDLPDGPGDGGGHEPLGQKAAPVSLTPQAMEGLPETNSFERFAMGDTLAVTTGTHATDPDKAAHTDGGSTLSPGKGGEAVWKSELSPGEQAILRRVFK